MRGTVRDSAGLPLSGALVLLGERETRTDQQGAFRLERVPPGPSLITIRLEGYATVRSRLVVPRGETLELAYLLTPAVEMLPTVVVEGRRTGIYGTVGDSAFRPVAGARVEVFGARGAELVTDSTGAFAIPGADRGVYWVRVSLEGHAERQLTVELERGQGRELVIRLMPAKRSRASTERGALRDLGLRLATGLRRDRLTPNELTRFGSTGLCDVPQIRAELRSRADSTMVILNGAWVLGFMNIRSLCAWGSDEVHLVEFGKDVCAEASHTIENLIPRMWCSGRNRAVTRSLRGSGGRISTQQPGSSYIVIWERR